MPTSRHINSCSASRVSGPASCGVGSLSVIVSPDGSAHVPGDSTVRCTTRFANTTVSSSEFEASRFAPCTPVQAHSPQAYSPGSVVSPQTFVRTPPIV